MRRCRHERCAGMRGCGMHGRGATNGMRQQVALCCGLLALAQHISLRVPVACQRSRAAGLPANTAQHTLAAPGALRSSCSAPNACGTNLRFIARAVRQNRLRGPAKHRHSKHILCPNQRLSSSMRCERAIQPCSAASSHQLHHGHRSSASLVAAGRRAGPDRGRRHRAAGVIEHQHPR